MSGDTRSVPGLKIAGFDLIFIRYSWKDEIFGRRRFRFLRICKLIGKKSHRRKHWQTDIRPIDLNSPEGDRNDRLLATK